MPTRECDSLVIVAANCFRETVEFGDIVPRGLVRDTGPHPFAPGGSQAIDLSGPGSRGGRR